MGICGVLERCLEFLQVPLEMFVRAIETFRMQPALQGLRRIAILGKELFLRRKQSRLKGRRSRLGPADVEFYTVIHLLTSIFSCRLPLLVPHDILLIEGSDFFDFPFCWRRISGHIDSGYRCQHRKAQLTSEPFEIGGHGLELTYEVEIRRVCAIEPTGHRVPVF